MPVGVPTVLNTAGAVGATATTASFTPTANALMIAFAAARGASATIPTVSDSLGGTWTPIGTGNDAGNVTGRLFYQVASGSPSAMTVTTNNGGGTQAGISVIELTDADTDFSNYQAGTNGAGDPSVTMSAYTSGSRVMAFGIGNAGAAWTSPSGFTELFDSEVATNLRMIPSYNDSSASTSLSWTSAATDSIGFGLEVKEASGTPSQTINGSLFADTDTFFGATVSPGPVTIAGSLFTNSNAFYTAVVSQAGAPQQIDGGLFTNTPQFFSATLTSVVRINAQLYNDPDQFFAATITVAGGGGGDSGAEYIILRRRRR